MLIEVIFPKRNFVLIRLFSEFNVSLLKVRFGWASSPSCKMVTFEFDVMW